MMCAVLCREKLDSDSGTNVVQFISVYMRIIVSLWALDFSVYIHIFSKNISPFCILYLPVVCVNVIKIRDIQNKKQYDFILALVSNPLTKQPVTNVFRKGMPFTSFAHVDMVHCPPPLELLVINYFISDKSDVLVYKIKRCFDMD